MNKKCFPKTRKTWIRGLAAGWACHFLGRVSAVRLAGGPSAPPAFREHDQGQVLEKEIHRMSARDTVRGSAVSPHKIRPDLFLSPLASAPVGCDTSQEGTFSGAPRKKAEPQALTAASGSQKMPGTFLVQQVNDVSLKGIKQGVTVL